MGSNQARYSKPRERRGSSRDSFHVPKRKGESRERGAYLLFFVVATDI